MRQGQQNHHHNNKRMRGRNNRKGPNPLTRSYESNGGDVKIRGTALHIAEKYVQLARDAQSSGDRVASENYLQHAEHYYRMVAAAQAQMPQPQPVFRSDGENDDEEDRAEGNTGFGSNQNYQGDQPSFGQQEPQPYVNGNGQGEDEGMRQANQTSEYPPQQNRYDNRGNQEFRGQDNRGGQEHRGGQDNRERGDFRGRRRRPFRERYQDHSVRTDAPHDGGPPPMDIPRGDD
jgi:hypothetical protein